MLWLRTRNCFMISGLLLVGPEIVEIIIFVLVTMVSRDNASARKSVDTLLFVAPVG